MTHFGEHWGGVCLAGEYTLERFLSAADDAGGDGALFEGRNSAGEPVLVKLVSAANPEERLFLWRRTVYLQHPNLLRVLDCGKSEEYIYAVLERPDDFLASALEQGPLEDQDAREFLAAGLDALRYLHAQGLVHGSLDAKHVVAVGNVVKLSTDNLREPDSEFSYAGDIGALGALLYHVLTGREFAERADGVGEPFATIIGNTAGVGADDRWRIPEILTAIGPPPPPPEPVPLQEVALLEPPPVAAAAEPVVEAPAAPITQRPPLPHTSVPHIPRWAWPASIAILAACFAWVLHTPAQKDAPAPAPVPAPAYVPPSQPAPAVVPPRPTVPPVETAKATHERTVWRVIAYTYNAAHDAEKKAIAINRKWPGLHAEVFAPKGRNHPPFLVALGGRMDRMEAARVLQRARSRGLPRDTFILNFAE